MSVLLIPAQLAGTSLTGATLTVSIAPGADLSAAPGTWTFTDVTADVMFRGPVQIGFGRADEQSQAQTSTCSFTLLNDAGDYTPRRPASAYWPNMRIGFPVKVVVTSAATGTVEMFTGYVDELKPSWDASMNVPTVAVECKGSIQRLEQGNRPLQSPASRVALDATTIGNVAAYWPATDEQGATVIGSGLPGGRAMRINGGTMTFGISDVIPGSEPLAEFGAGTTLVGDVDNGRASTTGWAVSRFLLAPGSALADLAVMMKWTMASGTIGWFELRYRTGGGLSLHAFNLVGTSIYDSGAIAYDFEDAPSLVSFEAKQNGANVDLRLYVGQVNDPTAGVITPTLSTQTMGKMTRFESGAGGTMQGWAIGHIGVANTNLWFFNADAILDGYAGELASDRVTRVCAEAGLPVTLSGTSNITMGPQPRGTIIDVLRDVEATDHGVLYDGIGFGVAYICRSERENASTDVILNITSGHVMPPFEPLENTRLVRNDVTVRRSGGSLARATQPPGKPYAASGAGSVGVFASEYTVNTATDDQLDNHAGWFLHIGTVDLDRYPSLSIDFTASPSRAYPWIGNGIGARVAVLGLPPTGGSVDPDLFVEGFTMEIGPKDWNINLNCSPASVYDVGRIQLARLDSEDSTVNTTASVGATSLSVASTHGVLWSTKAADVPFDINVRGRQITVSAVSGTSSPQTFTISPAPVALTAGSTVTLWEPFYLGL